MAPSSPPSAPPGSIADRSAPCTRPAEERHLLSHRGGGRTGRIPGRACAAARDGTGQPGLARHRNDGDSRHAADRGGFLDGGTVVQLAERLGVGARHLCRLFIRHVGAGPSAVATTRRVQAAKRMIDQTELSLAEIAFAAGFGSVRRFNAAFLATYRRPPSSLRRAAKRSPDRAGHIMMVVPPSTVRTWPFDVGCGSGGEEDGGTGDLLRRPSAPSACAFRKPPSGSDPRRDARWSRSRRSRARSHAGDAVRSELGGERAHHAVRPALAVG